MLKSLLLLSCSCVWFAVVSRSVPSNGTREEVTEVSCDLFKDLNHYVFSNVPHIGECASFCEKRQDEYGCVGVAFADGSNGGPARECRVLSYHSLDLAPFGRFEAKAQLQSWHRCAAALSGDDHFSRRRRLSEDVAKASDFANSIAERCADYQLETTTQAIEESYDTDHLDGTRNSMAGSTMIEILEISAIVTGSIVGFFFLLSIIGCLTTDKKQNEECWIPLGAGVCVGSPFLYGVAVGLGFAIVAFTDQCHGGNNSVQLRMNSMKLISDPTDGNGYDEIVIHMKSKLCTAKSKEYSMAKNWEVNPGTHVNSFYNRGFKVHLEEQDDFLYGGDDLSNVMKITGKKVAKWRTALKNDMVPKITFNYTFTVEGGTLFTENELLGLFASNLCISAFDFVGGAGKALRSTSKYLKGTMSATEVLKYWKKTTQNYASSQIRGATLEVMKEVRNRAIDEQKILEHAIAMANIQRQENEGSNYYTVFAWENAVSYGSMEDRIAASIEKMENTMLEALVTEVSGGNVLNEAFCQYRDMFFESKYSDAIKDTVLKVESFYSEATGTLEWIMDNTEICLDELVTANDAKYLVKFTAKMA